MGQVGLMAAVGAVAPLTVFLVLPGNGVFSPLFKVIPARTVRALMMMVMGGRQRL